MPTRACGASATTRSIERRRANARTASSRIAMRASIDGLGISSGRRCSPPSARSTAKKSSGTGAGTPVTIGSRSTLAALSTTSEIAFMPTHAPEARDSAQPYNPNSISSATLAGLSTGMRHDIIAKSLWCEKADDTQPWSSPATTSTPPCGEAPRALPCLSASPARSTPGPLPYHSPNTPCTLRSGSLSTSCEPSTAVAASSSFTAGRKRMRAASSCSRYFHNCWS